MRRGRQERRLDQLKLVLITNASMFHREAVARALEVLDANNGEIWAKLDAGTEAYYQQVARSVRRASSDSAKPALGGRGCGRS